MLTAMFGLGPTELAFVGLLLLVPVGVVAGIVVLAVWLGRRQSSASPAEQIAALQAKNRRLREEMQRLQPRPPS